MAGVQIPGVLSESSKSMDKSSVARKKCSLIREALTGVSLKFSHIYVLLVHWEIL